MGNVIKLKRSSVPGKVPSTSDLDFGEIGINTNSGKLYLKKDNGSQSIIDVGGNAKNIDILSQGTPTINNTIQTSLSLLWSSGIISGGAVINNNDGTVTMTSGEGMMRVGSDELSPLMSISFSSTNNLTLVDNAVNYIYLDYNLGSPIFKATTSFYDWNDRDKVLACVLTREGTDLNVIDATKQNVDLIKKYKQMLLEVSPIRVISDGGVLSSTNLNIKITTGGYYYGLNKISYATFDTSVLGTNNQNIFTYYYRNGSGGWNKTNNSKIIDNINYDDNSGNLIPLIDGKYKTEWVYIVNNNPTNIAIIYGNNAHNSLADAFADTTPNYIPPLIDSVGVLVGRYIIKKSENGVTRIENIINSGFQCNIVTNHNDLANIQGGSTDDYFHLTTLERNGLTLGYTTTLHKHSGESITNIPSGNITTTNVQSAINELDTKKATLTSPIFINNITTPLIKLGVSTLDSGTIITSSTNEVVLLSLPITMFRSSKINIQITQGSYHVTDLCIIHDGVNSYINEYGTIYTDVPLATFDANIIGENLSLLVKPNSNLTTTFKFVSNSIEL